jgi:hypothetical protein
MLHERHWTPEQANMFLPVVASTLRQLRDTRRRLLRRGVTVDVEASGGGWPGIEHARDSVAMALGFARLERLEIVVRDLDRGLIDFPAVMDGEEVYLCWLLDEPAVDHWHSIEAGFAGRRPLGD